MTLVALTLGALVLYIAVLAVQPALPDAHASGAEVVRSFAQHASALRWSVFFGTLALAAVMGAFGLMTGRLPDPERFVFLIAAVVYVTTTMLSFWFVGGLASHARTLEPGSARTLLDIVSYFGPLLTAASIALVGAVLAAGRRTRLPFWYIVLSGVFLTEQVVETITVFGRSGFAEPGGAMNLKLGAGLFILWFVATGVWWGLHPPDWAEAVAPV